MSFKILKDKIEEKFGSSVRYAKDCDVLAGVITAQTKQPISGSTLKRLFGIIPGFNDPRLYTLDLVSKYIGYTNYDDFTDQIQLNESTMSESFQEININNLLHHDKIKFEYKPEAMIIVQYQAKSQFHVLESLNSVLQVNDIIVFNQIVLNYPLFINEMIRGKVNLGAFIAGKSSGITSLQKIG